jgi:hypothetical protein
VLTKQDSWGQPAHHAHPIECQKQKKEIARQKMSKEAYAQNLWERGELTKHLYRFSQHDSFSC